MTGIASEVVGVDGLVSSRGVAESRHLVGGEGRVTNAFDFMVEFSTVGIGSHNLVIRGQVYRQRSTKGNL